MLAGPISHYCGDKIMEHIDFIANEIWFQLLRPRLVTDVIGCFHLCLFVSHYEVV